MTPIILVYNIIAYMNITYICEVYDTTGTARRSIILIFPLLIIILLKQRVKYLYTAFVIELYAR
jgi:hypothetical protein